MDSSVALRERRQHVRNVARNLVSLKKLDVDVSTMAGGELKAMRDVHHRMEQQAQHIETDLRHVYEKKDQIEAEIADCRQVFAINEALHRSRMELPHSGEDVDDPVASDPLSCGDA